jgi:eukaryotic-like serine/threonine-protein kinase
MGEVFAAHDPELDRLVAVKVLKVPASGVAGSSPTAQARFQREAQAMARLNHPNVVSVHDVGTVGERVFVAMELVEGPTLAAWLAGGPRSKREVVAIFLQAGRGLAAAHAAGIVHRDFKPANVILGDRVRVADFGLARALLDPVAEDGAAATPLEGVVTETGALVGTPAYMAPELGRGAPPSPRSDQYSFAVALHEAACGVRPGAAGASRPIKGRLGAILGRALAPDPDDRYPSVVALLADLERDPSRTRRLWMGAAAVALLVPATVYFLRPAAPTCEGLAARLDGVWDGARKVAVHSAFVATGIPYAEGAWRGVSAGLDDYGARWVAMATETCRATRVDGRQSDSLMDLRMACLERKRAVVAALTSLWSQKVDADTLAAGRDATEHLPPLGDCADVRALTEPLPLPGDAPTVAKITKSHADLDVVKADVLARHFAAARSAARSASAETDAIDWPEVRAEAAFAEGSILDQMNEPSAEPRLLEAVRLAEIARNDKLAASSLVRLVGHLANEHQDAARAVAVADIARGVVERSGDDALRVSLLRHRGDALRTQGRFGAARAVFAAAYVADVAREGAHSLAALSSGARLADAAEDDSDYADARRLGEDNLSAAIAVLGPDDPRVANKLNNLAITAANGGDREAAVGYYHRSLELKTALYGPETVQAAGTMMNLAVVEIARGHLADAEPLVEHSVAVYERAFGADHVQVAKGLTNLSTLRRKQGRFVEALATAKRALESKIKAYGPAHASVAVTMAEIGLAQENAGDLEAALATQRAGFDVRMKTLGPKHAATLESMSYVIRLLARLGRCAEAQPIIAQALDAVQTVFRADHPARADILLVSARCDLARGRAAEALASVERALPIVARATAAAIERGSADWELARALAALGRRDEAVVAARRAAEELAGDADGDAERGEARAFLASVPSRRARR